jgi:hypothetical protein
MELTETRISGASIWMRFSESPDARIATRWIEFQVHQDDLLDPYSRESAPLGDPELQPLGVIRLAALRRARDVIASEIRRLSDQSGRTP